MDREYTGPELLELRKRALLSQREVVELADVNERTITLIELGRSKPQGRTLRKLLELYAQRIERLEGIYGVLEGKS